MQVTSFEINVIEAKRFAKVSEKMANIRIDHNSTVSQISKLSDSSASVEYRFTVNYAGMGFIKMEGNMVLEVDANEVLKEWTATGSMPNDVANLVHNTVVSNCIPTALLVARDVRMPPPFPLPRINIQKKSEPSRPSGPEVA